MALALVAGVSGVRTATACSGRARSAGAEVLVRGSGGVTVLVPGSAAEIHWGALPTAVDEFELLLSIDGGRTFPVRLTPQLEPGRRTFHWVVPNLPTAHACVRMRVGSGGVESDAGASAEFMIAARDDLPAASLRFAGGEWWQTSGVPLIPVELAHRSARMATRDPRERTEPAALARTHRTSWVANHRPVMASSTATALSGVRPLRRQGESRPLAVPHRE